MMQNFRKYFAVIFAVFLMSCSFSVEKNSEKELAEDFKLFGVDLRYHRAFSSFDSDAGVEAVVIIFTSNSCPLSIEYEDVIINLANKYQPMGFPFIAVNSNPADMVPEDGFPYMVERAEEKGYPFPYLYDETQKVAESYKATATPEVFVIGRNRKILYKGAVDNFGQEPFYLAAALDDIIAGRPVGIPETPPLGCMIHYRTKKSKAKTF